MTRDRWRRAELRGALARRGKAAHRQGMRCRPLVLWLLAACAACGTPPAHVAHPASPPAPAAPPVLANHAPPAPTAPVHRGAAVLAWPVAPFTPAQITEATGCDVDKLAEQRYAKELAVDALPGAFAAQTTCDRAALAAACAARVKGGDPPPACLDAYRAVVAANPAFAFVDALADGYFGRLPLVDPPPHAARTLTGVVLAYKWDGLGHPVAWTLTVTDAATHPSVQVSGKSAPASVKQPATLGDNVAALGHALGGFLPVRAPLQAVDCTDNYPDWTAHLTFDDGSALDLATHGSNLLGLGGPWQLALGNTTYLQLSPDFTKAVAQLVEALALPIGEPEGEFCRGYDIESAVLEGTAP